jgi:hypothetical protein
MFLPDAPQIDTQLLHKKTPCRQLVLNAHQRDECIDDQFRNQLPSANG